MSRTVHTDNMQFGPHYKNHQWERMDRGVAMRCTKKGCGIIWRPDQTSKNIRWCKGQ